MLYAIGLAFTSFPPFFCPSPLPVPGLQTLSALLLRPKDLIHAYWVYAVSQQQPRGCVFSGNSWIAREERGIQKAKDLHLRAYKSNIRPPVAAHYSSLRAEICVYVHLFSPILAALGRVWKTENDAYLGTYLLFHVSLLRWGTRWVWDGLWESRMQHKPLECSLFSSLSTKGYLHKQDPRGKMRCLTKEMERCSPGVAKMNFFYYLLNLYWVKSTAK